MQSDHRKSPSSYSFPPDYHSDSHRTTGNSCLTRFNETISFEMPALHRTDALTIHCQIAQACQSWMIAVAVDSVAAVAHSNCNQHSHIQPLRFVWNISSKHSFNSNQAQYVESARHLAITGQSDVCRLLITHTRYTSQMPQHCFGCSKNNANRHGFFIHLMHSTPTDFNSKQYLRCRVLHFNLHLPFDWRLFMQ